MRVSLYGHLLACVWTCLASSEPGASLAPVQDVRVQLGEIDAQGTLPSNRGGHSLLESVDRRLLLWGGCDLAMECDTSLFALSTESETWELVETQGTPPSGRMGHSAWVDRTSTPYMWIFGGFQKDDGKGHFSNDLSVLHLASMRWSKPVVSGDAPSARYEVATVRLNASHTFLHGGSDDKSYFDDAYLFDSDRYIWTKVQTRGEQPLSRESHTAVYVEATSQVIVYGGYHRDQCLDDTFALDLKTMTWHLLAARGPGARGGHAAFVMGGKMFVLGGCNEPLEQCHNTLELFDAGNTKQWARANLTRSVSSREWSNAVVVDRSVYVFGGCLPNDKCLNDLWLMEFESPLDDLQLVSTKVEAQVTSRVKEVETTAEVPRSEEGHVPIAQFSVTVVSNATTNTSNVTVDCSDHRPPPSSRPGRDMMEALKEVRRQLRLAETDCEEAKSKVKRMRNSSATEDTGPLYPEQFSTLTHCPPGTVAVPLEELNLEMFNRMIRVTNDTLTARRYAEEQSLMLAQIALLEVSSEDDGVVHDETGLRIDGNETLGLFPFLSLANVTVCFGPSGPVGIIGSNMTLQQLYAALNYNRTLEPSTRNADEFKASPSPSPIPYNNTQWEEQGRFMGRRVNQGKRRPLAEVADRVDDALTRLNCTDPLAANRPECTVPFANLSGHLNATANWTALPGSGGSGDVTIIGDEPDGTGEGGVDTDPGTGGAGGDTGTGGDSAGGGLDGSSSDAGTPCAEGDEDCEVQGEDCAPDDLDCLARSGQSPPCAEGDTACQEASGGAGEAAQGTLGGRRIRKKNRTLWQQISLFFQQNGSLLVLLVLAALAGFVAIGAVMTNILKEKRKLTRLEQSLKDAQLKQEDEVWTKSVVNPNM